MDTRIVKVINNNVLTILDNEGNETVVMGKGIGFRKKPGDLIPYDSIKKTFSLRQKEINSKFQQLVTVLPSEHIILSEKIIQMVYSVTGWKLNDNIYITLTDHISGAIRRYEQNIELDNALLWDIRQLYPEEYLVAQQALDIIEEECKIRFSDDEAAYIALHFVNARINTDENMELVHQVTKIIREISSIIKYYFHIEQNLESEEDYPLINQIRILASQILQSAKHEDMHEELYQVIEEYYSKINPCAKKIKKFLADQYSYEISGEEMLSLVLSISQFLSGYQERKTNAVD
ncbi:PRD domain-containing protein [Blautia liquoris]|uniref:PRD domain-containing protein n=1 Tax=Blautia liquoris TaxID=2779518 RepID=A0A7M2RCT4_9FIRM|nr:PRD domain-containing protein [Blautia liquoris]QOV18139.1 PRD domain-containing protein [Blautia liquoris]